MKGERDTVGITPPMKTIFCFILLAIALLWIVNLQRQLRQAQMRGDMYRDTAERLDQRLAELLQRHAST